MNDEAQQDEAAAIASMKARADEYGLWWEVEAAYKRYRASGDDPATAAFSALYDWDL